MLSYIYLWTFPLNAFQILVSINSVFFKFSSYDNFVIKHYYGLIRHLPIQPGGGREYTHSPVGENATLQRRVSNSTIIWEVDNLAFNRPGQRAFLNHRNIHQFDPPALPSVLVVGDVKNNSSRVCCSAVVGEISEGSCTTLVLYGKNLEQH